MPSMASVLAHRRENMDIRRRVVADLRAFWGTLDPSDARGSRDALLAALPPLVEQYGEIAATVAADYYDDLREQAGVRGRYVAELAPPVDHEAIRASTRWAVDPLFGGDGEAAALARLITVVDRMALQPGRDTIAASVHGDPADATYARIPDSDPCAWCLMLASRGAVYASEASAGGLTDWHNDCDCEATPFWPGDEYPRGYDPDALYERYNDARRKARSGDPKKITKALRELEGIN